VEVNSTPHTHTRRTRLLMPMFRREAFRARLEAEVGPPNAGPGADAVNDASRD